MWSAIVTKKWRPPRQCHNETTRKINNHNSVLIRSMNEFLTDTLLVCVIATINAPVLNIPWCYNYVLLSLLVIVLLVLVLSVTRKLSGGLNTDTTIRLGAIYHLTSSNRSFLRNCVKLNRSQ